jgi:DNA adenine methylase
MKKVPLKNPPQAKVIIRWAGSKRPLIKFLLPLIPVHECYVEVFCGGLSLFLAKPRSDLEVINDTHGDLINLYRIVKFHWPELERELAWELNSRRQFQAFRDQPGLTDIQRAARWFIRRKNCFAGDGQSFGRSKKSGGAAHSSLKTKLELLAGLHARLDKTIIENLDWKKCVAHYDGPETFFFFDPPYLGGSPKSYRAWDREQWQEMADALPRLQAHWLLTCGDSPASRQLFRRYRLKRVTRPMGITPGAAMRELIVTEK